VSENHRPDNSSLPLDPPADMPPLDAMAVVDAFADACERGEATPLGEWLRRYPEHAAALADYAAAMFSESETNVTNTGAQQTYGELSPGTLRALGATFSGTPVPWPEHPLLRVAEPPSSYNARAAGILALAHARDLDLEQLAQAVDLSQQLLLWLDCTPIHRGQQPYRLVQRLAEALGVDAEHVAQALAVEGDIPEGEAAQRNSVLGATSLEEAIRRSTTLSTAQRARWLVLVKEDDPSLPDNEV
jgi:hypothetical protein